jgi:small ligand-binding sensory domain FIST
MKAQAAIEIGTEALEVIDRLIDRLQMISQGETIELALLFASDAYRGDFPALMSRVKQGTGASVVLGCSGQGLIGPGREIEEQPAISLQVFSLPGARLTPVRLGAEELSMRENIDVLREKLAMTSSPRPT